MVQRLPVLSKEKELTSLSCDRLTSLSQSPSETVTKMSLSLPRNVLTPDDIYKHYREAIIHYSKVSYRDVICLLFKNSSSLFLVYVLLLKVRVGKRSYECSFIVFPRSTDDLRAELIYKLSILIVHDGLNS